MFVYIGCIKYSHMYRVVASVVLPTWAEVRRLTFAGGNGKDWRLLV